MKISTALMETGRALEVLFALVFLVVGGCAPRTEGSRIPLSAPPPSLVGRSLDPQALLQVNSVLLLPVAFREETREQEVRSGFFNSELENAANAELQLKVVSGFELGRAVRSFHSREALIAAGREAGVDGVIAANLLEYAERIGSSVGATRGAVVSLTVRMYRVSDEREVWSASYHFRDRALSEDLLQLGKRFDQQHGAGWRRADELLREGFVAAFRDLARLREEMFAPGCKTSGGCNGF